MSTCQGSFNLFCVGDRTLLGADRKRVAVVGSRRMTDYGRRGVEMLIAPLVEAGVVVVSGFMYGVDQEAHRQCLDCGGKTIAVLGWGVDWVVPEEDRALYIEIKNRGLLVSEYEGQTPPALWRFPKRNKVIASMADAVIVIEAGEKSGSLITADWAIKFGKPLFCVPGPIVSRVSYGTNDLIKQGLAEMVTSADDVLTTVGIKRGFSQDGEKLIEGRNGSLEFLIVDILENESLFVDEIARKIRRPVVEISPVLTRMEIAGNVRNDNGRYSLV